MDDILNYTIPENQIGIWWLGQSGFIIKTPNGKITVIDAYLSNSAVNIRLDLDRLTPIPIQPEELICDYYICTHNHIDHFDPETIERLKNKDSITFIGPRNVVKAFQQLKDPINNAVLLEAGETIQFRDISLTGTFCIPNKDAVLDSIGVIFQHRGKTIYHSGDTGYHPFLEYIEKFNIDLSMMCINGKLGNMNYSEAYLLCKAIKPKIVIPCHFDMFVNNFENPNLFCQLIEYKKTGITCLIPEIGIPIID